MRAVPLCIPMREAPKELAGTLCETSDQHPLFKDHDELTQARVTRDGTDQKHLCGWLRSHNPFEYADWYAYSLELRQITV